jgi:hypothetical protein
MHLELQVGNNSVLTPRLGHLGAVEWQLGQRRTLPLLCYQRRKACSCFNIIIIKSLARVEEARLSDDIVILYGCWTAFKSDTLSDRYRFYHLSE